MKILDEQQLKFFLEVAKKDKYWLYFKLACVTGARINELLALEWEDMDFKNKLVRISKQVQHEIGVKDYIITTKTGKGRNIQLGDNTINDILEYRELTQSSSGLIFKKISGEFVNPCCIRNHFFRILNDCNLPRIRIHDLRHTAVSIMLNNNVPVTIVSEILGHSSINTTLTVYAHAIPNQQYKATEIMDNF